MSQRIVITSIGGFKQLKNLTLPITVNAEEIYKGCYRVFAVEFRAFLTGEFMSAASNGKGLAYSFCDVDNYHVLAKEQSSGEKTQ